MIHLNSFVKKSVLTILFCAISFSAQAGFWSSCSNYASLVGGAVQRTAAYVGQKVWDVARNNANTLLGAAAAAGTFFGIYGMNKARAQEKARQELEARTYADLDREADALSESHASRNKFKRERDKFERERNDKQGTVELQGRALSAAAREKRELVERNEQLKCQIGAHKVAHAVQLGRQQSEIARLQAENTRNNEVMTKLGYETLQQMIAHPTEAGHPFARAGFVTQNAAGQWIVEDVAQNLNASISSHDRQLLSPEAESVIQVDDTEWIHMAEQRIGDFAYTLESKTVAENSFGANGKMLLVCVHGTFSNAQSFGANETKKTTQYLISFAKQLAHAHKKAVEIVSYTWTGSLSNNARAEAGRILGDALAQKIQESPCDQLWVFAHSHGCNVAALAAQRLNGVRMIDVGIHVASPTPDIAYDREDVEMLDPETAVTNYKRMYHFYGTADLTQAVGSLFSNGTLERKWLVPSGLHKVYNIRLQVNGQNLNHINIKWEVARNLVGLLHAIDTHYPAHFDLDANYDLMHNDAPTYPTVALRHNNVTLFTYKPLADCFPDTLQRTLDYSAQQQQKFVDTHGRPLDDKGDSSWGQWLASRCAMPINEFMSRF